MKKIAYYESSQKNQIKSKKRVADYGEVFTSEREVNDMLDLVKQETERLDSRFLEPACGSGNFLVEILKRKLGVAKKYKRNQLDYERYVFLTVSSIYGIDILQDNINDCIEQLFELFDMNYSGLYKNKCKNEFRETIKYILEVHRSVDLMEEGSLLKDKIEKVFGSITTVFCQLLEDLRTKFIGLEFVNFKPIQIRLSSPP